VRQEPPSQTSEGAANRDAHHRQAREENANGAVFPRTASALLSRVSGSLSCLLVLLIFTVAAVPVSTIPTPGDDVAGRALAEKIRSSVPTENLERHAFLLIDSKSGHKEIPVDCHVIVHPDSGNWESIYQTTGTNQQPAHRLVISHVAGAPNHYDYDDKPVAAADTQIPFAGTDYSIGDLGLDFLHWPGQSQMKGEMRLGEPCYVLVSTNAPAGGIARVKSYIDKEYNSPLIAEAYDTNGVLVKSFSLHLSSFKKVNGQYQPEKLEIQNEKTGSHTVLKFDMPKDK
jgi:Outer membrane lipoprotein-sorting protein